MPVWNIFDSSVLTADDHLQIQIISSVRADHPSNAKRVGVLVYYKSYLPLKLIDVRYLHGWIKFKLRIGGKLVTFCLFIDNLVKTEMNLKRF